MRLHGQIERNIKDIKSKDSWYWLTETPIGRYPRQRREFGLEENLSRKRIRTSASCVT